MRPPLPLTCLLLLLCCLACQGPERPPLSGVDAAWQRQIELAGELFREGQPALATMRARDALELAEGVFEPDDPRRVTSLLTLSSLLLQQGRIEEAGQYANRALEDSERILVAARTRVTASLKAVGSVDLLRGDADRAAEVFARALEIQERTYGPQSPRLAGVLEGYAAVLRRADRPAEAAVVEARLAGLARE